MVGILREFPKPPRPASEISRFLGAGCRIDFHLLYYRWTFKDISASSVPNKERSGCLGDDDMESQNQSVVHIRPKTTQRERIAGPLLVQSARNLRSLKPPSEEAGCKWYENTAARFPPWTHRLTPLWVYQEGPSITVSGSELLSLSLILGIRLRGKRGQFVPHGVSAFGSVLISEKRSIFTVLSLVLDRHYRSAKSSAGSGYSLLFALDMACGYLPFAQVTFPSSDGEEQQEHRGRQVVETHCIVVTSEPRRRILAGAPLDSSDVDDWKRPDTGIDELSLPTNVTDEYWSRKTVSRGYENIPYAYEQH